MSHAAIARGAKTGDVVLDSYRGQTLLREANHGPMDKGKAEGAAPPTPSVADELFAMRKSADELADAVAAETAPATVAEELERELHHLELTGNFGTVSAVNPPIRRLFGQLNRCLDGPRLAAPMSKVIQYMDLTGEKIGDRGVVLIAKYLATDMMPLVELVLTHTGTRSAGARALGVAMWTNTVLQKLQLAIAKYDIQVTAMRRHETVTARRRRASRKKRRRGCS